MHGIKLEQTQQHNLSQAYIRSLEILALSNAELQATLENEYLENPIFEYSENSRKGSVTSNQGMEELSMLEEQEENIVLYIKEQLDFKKYNKKELEIIEYLTENLDENGYCPVDEKEVSEKFHTTGECIRKCLNDLKGLEPVGIFSRNLQECLLIQAEYSEKDDEYLEEIIKNYLPDIASGKFGKITKNLKISTNEVRKYAASIAKFNPRPLQGMGKSRNRYVIPDIILEAGEDGWEIYLNDNWTENYHLNEFYVNMIGTTQDTELRKYFEEKLKRARALFGAIEQRRSTILKVVKCIIIRQANFFSDHGALKPMTMEQIAGDAGVHISSVSRAIHEKYMQYPGGTVYLKDLFTASVKQLGGEDIGAEEIKSILEDIVRTENKKRPYSDSKIVGLFKEKEIEVSRRTIAKYREELGIKGSFARKELTDE